MTPEAPRGESWASSPAVRSVMRANGSRDTIPERRLRSLLHERGLRYRVDVAPIAGSRRRADVVFSRARVAIFVDGCYWHGCPDHYRPARLNATFWSTKITENRRRDAETTALLRRLGWTVIRVWEHEDPATAADQIEAVLAAASSTSR